MEGFEVAVVAAAVAGLVTLAIEYFAKPTQEVRKDAILSRHRRIESVRDRLQLIQMKGTALADMIGTESPNDLVIAFVDELEAASHEAISSTR